MKKILIFKTDRIGDLINISPIIKNLKINYPKSKIYIFCSNYNSQIGKYYIGKDVEDVFLFEKNFFLFFIKFFKFLFINKFDLILQLDGKKKSYFYSAIIPAKIKACIKFIKYKKIFNFKYKISRPNFISSFFYKIQIKCIEDYENPKNKTYHYLKLYFKILEHLNIKIKDKTHYLPFSPKIRLKLNNYSLIHIDERWNNFNKDFLNNFIKKLINSDIYKNYVITSNYNSNFFFEKLEKKLKLKQNVLFVKNTTVDDLLSIIYFSNCIISSHTGFLVHAGSAFKKDIIDIVNKDLSNELDRWIPFGINYKRVFFNDISKLDI